MAAQPLALDSEVVCVSLGWLEASSHRAAATAGASESSGGRRGDPEERGVTWAGSGAGGFWKDQQAGRASRAAQRKLTAAQALSPVPVRAPACEGHRARRGRAGERPRLCGLYGYFRFRWSMRGDEGSWTFPSVQKLQALKTSLSLDSAGHPSIFFLMRAWKDSITQQCQKLS